MGPETNLSAPVVKTLGYHNVTGKAEGFLMDIARLAVISLCFMAAKEVEHPGLMRYSNPRLLKAPSR